MIKTPFFFTLLLLGLFISCPPSDKPEKDQDVQLISNPEYGIWQSKEKPPFKFRLIDSIKVETPSDHIFGKLNALVTDENGNIYLFDEQQNKLVSFSSEGIFRWIVGEEGRGPGDFENVNDLVVNDNRLIVGNQNGVRIDFYDFNGNYLQSKTVPKEVEFRYFRYANLQGFSSDNHFIINTIHWDGWGHNVYVLDFETDSVNVVNRFLIDQSNGLEIPELLNVSAPLTLHDDKMISGSLQDYSVTVHDLDGNLEKIITKDFDKIIRPGMYNSQGRKSMDFYAMVKAPVILPPDYWMVPSYWATNVFNPDERLEQDLNDAEIPDVTYRNSLDFFSSEDELLYSIEADGEHPNIGEISYVDEKGIIYVLNNKEDPVIYRYKVLTPKS